MKIAIIGASAGIGAATVKLALQRGHTVMALSRNNEALPEHASLTKITGTALSAANLQKTISGTDAVIVTIGTKQKKGTTLFSDLAKVLSAVCSEINYKGNVIIVTGFGTSKSAQYLSFFMRLIISLFLKDQYKDKTYMEGLISKSPMNWEFVKPGMLTDGPLTSRYQVLTELYKGMKITKIPRADVADYLVTEAEHARFLRQHVALTIGSY